jgi:ubiquinol-cytochrome c reductase iron-sulfur subunit
MNEDDVDRINRNRRHFLTVATAVTGVAGVGLAAIPFLASLKPSARAQALGAPVEVPVGSLEPGEMAKVIWRGKLIYVLHRSKEMLAHIEGHNDELRDPDSKETTQQPAYAQNDYRSVKPAWLVVEGRCTHLGCAPLKDFDPRPGDNWPGGFFCPCHGSKFDLSGRVFKGVPAPLNLNIPPYRFVRDDLILIGQDTGAA